MPTLQSALQCPQWAKRTSVIKTQHSKMPIPMAVHSQSSTTTLPPLTHLHAVLFDVDGTLVDSDPLHFTAFREILLEHPTFNNGQPISIEFFNTTISGRHNPAIAKELFPHWDEAQGAAFSDDKEQRFRALVKAQGLSPTRGLSPTFLDALAAHDIRVAAVTNAPKQNVAVMLEALQLGDLFEVMIFGEDCTHPKPHPEPYLTAMQALGVTEPTRVLVVEDSPSGVRAGVASGAHVAAITAGHAPERLLEAGAHVTVENFDQLLNMLGGG